MVDDNYAKCLNAPSTSTHGWLRMLAWGASRDQPKPCSNLFKIMQYLPGMGQGMEASVFARSHVGTLTPNSDWMALSQRQVVENVSFAITC